MAETFLVKCLKPTIELETFDLLSVRALPSKWTSREPPSPESLQENISIGHSINNKCGYKPHAVRDATLAMNTELEDFVRKGNNSS